MTSVESQMKLIEQVDMRGAFTEEEFTSYRQMFMKYDQNKSLALEIFELHQMYEDQGETKTNMQLRQLIRDADPSAIDGINYKSFLTILLKDKKGETRSALGGLFVQLLAPVEAKQHKTPIGRVANVFEEKMANQANDCINEENIKRQREVGKIKRETQAKLKREEQEAAAKEAERKRKVQEGLARLKSGING